jgi:hypothetical protein
MLNCAWLLLFRAKSIAFFKLKAAGFKGTKAGPERSKGTSMLKMPGV